MGMRGIHTSINDIRKQVFTEVARLSYQYAGDLSDMEISPTASFPAKCPPTGKACFWSAPS